MVQYAFGSGDRGLTLVGRDAAGRAYELRLSEYPEAHGEGSAVKPSPRWDVTVRASAQAVARRGIPGTAAHRGRRPPLPDLPRHRPAIDRRPTRVRAHQTGRSAARLCHGPGGNHLLAVEGKLIETRPGDRRPTLASGARIVKLCTECHSPRGQEVLPRRPDGRRFQGTTLTWSRCYTESNDQLDCMTCHDPHRNASSSLAHYEARCLECHSRSAGKPTPQTRRSRPRLLRDGATRTTCPVNPSTGCVGCHMPAVERIVPHSSFTDHFIRVHRD